MTVKFNKIPQNILDENNIIKFHGISEIFDFIYDEDWTKEEIIEQLTDDMKKQLVLKNENVRIDEENYYYGSDIYYFEEDLKEGKIEGYKIDLNSMNTKTIVEELLSMTMGIPVTIGDENIDQIQKEMGNLGVEIYERYYDWYKEYGMYEIYDYIDAFCYGKINDIQEIIDEVIEYTSQNEEINPDEKIKIIKQAELYKEFLDKEKRLEAEEEMG